MIYRYRKSVAFGYVQNTDKLGKFWKQQSHSLFLLLLRSSLMKARCTTIHQYLQFWRENDFVPVSRSTMWRVLEVQEACQRKTLRGLDNTAADGAEGSKLYVRLSTNWENLEQSVNVIAGDSIVKNVIGAKMSSGDPDNFYIVKSFLGATLEDMSDFVKPLIRRKPTVYGKKDSIGTTGVAEMLGFV